MKLFVDSLTLNKSGGSAEEMIYISATEKTVSIQSRILKLLGLHKDEQVDCEESDFDALKTNGYDFRLYSLMTPALKASDVSNIVKMRDMFSTSMFNGDISNWDVSKVTDMTMMFFGSEFNGNISKWDVSKVTDMSWMFASSVFNGDISNWNTPELLKTKNIFRGSKFTGDIAKWKRKS